MPSNQTPNYQLSQWEAGDRVQRADFNTDNTKIDAALGALAAQLTAEVNKERIVIGSYTGNDSGGEIKTRIIPLPWTPKLLLVSGYLGSLQYIYNGLVIAFGAYSHTLEGPDGNIVNGGNIKIVENGFQITGIAHNIEGQEEHYIAIR